jgi:hypothetical protein
MKKKIRSEITKLANQIIAEKNNFDIGSMKNQVGQLYEQLSVLFYLEGELEGKEDDEQGQALDSKSYREENWFTEPEPLPQSLHQDELVEPLIEKIKDIVAQMPEEAQEVDELLDKVLPKKEYLKNDLEEFASQYPQTPTFERKEPSKGTDVREEKPSTNFPADKNIKTLSVDLEEKQTKPISLNDKLHQGLNIGLNDRLAFIKQLFEGNAEDYMQTLAHIDALDSFNDAVAYIDATIKPEYNYWLGKEEYSGRFMTIIEKSFN